MQKRKNFKKKEKIKGDGKSILCNTNYVWKQIYDKLP